MLQPWADCGRAAAIDSTVLSAKGGVWHKKDREAGIVPHSSIDTEAHWTKSGWHGWVYGWKLHLVTTVAAVWIPLAADLTAANVADNEHALRLLPELPAEIRYLLGDQQFKGIFDVHRPVPTKGLVNTRRFALGAISSTNSVFGTVLNSVSTSVVVSRPFSKPPDYL